MTGKVALHQHAEVKSTTTGRLAALSFRDVPDRRPAPIADTAPSMLVAGLLPVLPKLTVSSPTDSCEREAERVAEVVVGEGAAAYTMAMRPDADVCAQRQIEEEAPPSAGEGEAAGGLPGDDLPEGLELDGSVLPMRLPGLAPTTALLAHPGSPTGQPLPATARRLMESRFGHDFSSVRVHTDAEAERATRSINAAAFTIGQHIYFRDGHFDPVGKTGRRLLAHELTHVVQQAGGDWGPGQMNRMALYRPPIHPLPAVETTDLLRTVEAHVNLRTPQRVRIYDGTSTQDFETSAGTGTRTSRLIPQSPLPIIGKRSSPTAKVGRWGLQYFTWFTTGGIGFHSNICYPRPDRRRTVLTVDGTPRSHGCLRLRERDAMRVYDALSVGDQVYVYNERVFRPASSAGP